MNVDDSDLEDQLDTAQRRVFEHPGYIRYRDLDAFALCLTEVFRANHLELMALLEQASSDETLAIELIQNVHDDAVRRRFQARTTQRLHNYLAATLSLVDHSRRLMRGYSGPLAEQFDRRKKDLLRNGEVGFMMDLRVFTQHRTLPALAHRLSLEDVNTPKAKMDSEVELRVVDLIQWEKWSATSRRFLGAHGGAVRLRPVVKRHGTLVFGFNAWLYEALADENAPALAETNRLVLERNAALIGGSMEDAKVFTDRTMAERAQPPRRRSP